MPKRLKVNLEENIYPVWKVIFKKKIQEQSDSTIPFGMEIVEILPNGAAATVYRKILTGDLYSQSIHRLSFAAFSLCLQEGRLIFSELERECNLVVETEAEVCFAENSYLSGYLRIEKASTVTNKAELEVQGTLGISCEKFINQGSIFSERLEVVSSPRCQGVLSLDNRNGQIQAKKALRLQAGSLDNQYGKILGQRLEIQAFGQFDNRRGVVLAKEGVSVYLINHFNNTEGQIESEAGMVSIQCKKGQILSRHFACLRSQTGNVILEAPYILVDETSLVHGKVISKIIAKQKLRQESVLSAEQLFLEADQFDLHGGMVGQQQLDIVSGKEG